MDIDKKVNISNMISIVFGILVFIIGLVNMFIVHPVPGVFYILISLIYFPLVTGIFKKRWNIPVPAVVKIILGIVIIMFTLGVSDLGDMIDKGM